MSPMCKYISRKILCMNGCIKGCGRLINLMALILHLLLPPCPLTGGFQVNADKGMEFISLPLDSEFRLVTGLRTSAMLERRMQTEA